MSWKPFKRKSEWLGKRVRVVEEMRNGLTVIPAGMVLTVDEVESPGKVHL